MAFSGNDVPRGLFNYLPTVRQKDWYMEVQVAT